MSNSAKNKFSHNEKAINKYLETKIIEKTAQMTAVELKHWKNMMEERRFCAYSDQEENILNYAAKSKDLTSKVESEIKKEDDFIESEKIWIKMSDNKKRRITKAVKKSSIKNKKSTTM